MDRGAASEALLAQIAGLSSQPIKILEVNRDRTEAWFDTRGG